MPAKKRPTRKAGKRNGAHANGTGEVIVRLERVERSVAELIEIAERHGDAVGAKEIGPVAAT